MYMLREDVNVSINQTKASKIIGISQVSLSKIFTRKNPCRKNTAYCITKYISEEAEIENFFIRVK